MIIGTFILDFQTVDFEPDAKVAVDILNTYQRQCGLQGEAFALDEPVEKAGWSFAKLFLAGQFAEELYSRYKQEIDGAKGKKFEDKFIGWLASQLKNGGCGAQIKAAPEMKSRY